MEGGTTREDPGRPSQSKTAVSQFSLSEFAMHESMSERPGDHLIEVLEGRSVLDKRLERRVLEQANSMLSVLDGLLASLRNGGVQADGMVESSLRDVRTWVSVVIVSNMHRIRSSGGPGSGSHSRAESTTHALFNAPKSRWDEPAYEDLMRAVAGEEKHAQFLARHYKRPLIGFETRLMTHKYDVLPPLAPLKVSLESLRSPIFDIFAVEDGQLLTLCVAMVDTLNIPMECYMDRAVLHRS